jgi:hypothetical protein
MTTRELAAVSASFSRSSGAIDAAAKQRLLDHVCGQMTEHAAGARMSELVQVAWAVARSDSWWSPSTTSIAQSARAEALALLARTCEESVWRASHEATARDLALVLWAVAQLPISSLATVSDAGVQRVCAATEPFWRVVPAVAQSRVSELSTRDLGTCLNAVSLRWADMPSVVEFEVMLAGELMARVAR